MPAASELRTDADFFTTLHRALAELASDPVVERRRGARRSFSYVQLLAPYDGGPLPAQEAYSRVLCHDLSPSGFSYVAEQRPQTRQLIAALGRTPFRFFLAQVVNQRLIEQGGARRVLVGCRFLRRITDEA
jgi:hypothetical protein